MVFVDVEKNAEAAQRPLNLVLAQHTNAHEARKISDGTKEMLYIFGSSTLLSKEEEYQKGTYEDSREVKHPTTYLETVNHLIKACLGTGILAMPSAFNHSGWLIGIIGTIMTGIVCTYLVHMLLETEAELCRRKKVRNMTYHTTAQAAFEEGPEMLRWLAPYMPFVTKFLFLFGIVGGCCIYIVFISSNLKAVADHFLDPAYHFHVRWYMFAHLPPLVILSWIRNLKFLAPLSSIGTVLTFIGFGIVFFYMVQDLPPISTREATGSLSGLTFFFVTVMFSLEAMPVIMPLKNEMKNPKRFATACGVLNVAMVPNLMMFLSVGLVGFLKYGPDVKASITLNMPEGEILAEMSRVLIASAIFITLPLAGYMGFDIAWNGFLAQRIEKNKLFKEYCLRTGLVVIEVFMAITVPHLDLVISLVGAMTLTTLGMAFPAILHLITFWNDRSGLRFFFWSFYHFFFIILGVFGLVVGASTSLKEVVHRIFEEND
uniref:Proton-coupled amino acid transporter 4 n=1 Tax=Lygus hesperus TaxID=30085 RepID=A0A146M014_LYGHE